jgi:hypothetical protein
MPNGGAGAARATGRGNLWPDRSGSAPSGTTARYRSVQHGGCRYVFVADDAFYDRATLYVGPGRRRLRLTMPPASPFSAAPCSSYGIARGQTPDDLPSQRLADGARCRVICAHIYRVPELAAAHSLFTLHNLAYQGPLRRRAAVRHRPGLERVPHRVSSSSTRCSTCSKAVSYPPTPSPPLSPSYAEEIQQPAFGYGLDGVLRAARDKLTGILNGIGRDPLEPRRRSVLARASTTPARIGAGKALLQTHLQRSVGPAGPRRSRSSSARSAVLDVQKGDSADHEALRMVAPLPVQLVALGSGDAGLEHRMRALAAAYPQTKWWSGSASMKGWRT